ncbi:hypothetical protein IWZ03DRAFT_414606 [Phyllosticta citriasiana]|uniref:Uncharacterized protein n=1 Tax=Phyllosticta citriasiana TaxID=595635 RepID=A0ABR1KP79_9PEZI
MTEKSLILIIFVLSAAFARPLHRRQVPDDPSYGQVLSSVNTNLKANNPDGISDAMFGLLVRSQAAVGQGSVTDTNCLQQAVADRAFTNAKATGNVNGMTNALVYRALERNAGSVGQPSNACTSSKAINPEIEPVTQHQDPAIPGAADANRFITLRLAQQIAAVGDDPQSALKAGSYGMTSKDIQDATGAGNGAANGQAAPNGGIATATGQNPPAAGAAPPPKGTPGQMAAGSMPQMPPPPPSGTPGMMPLPRPPSPGSGSDPMAAGMMPPPPPPPPPPPAPPMGTPGAMMMPPPPPPGMTPPPMNGQGAGQGNGQQSGQNGQGNGQGNAQGAVNGQGGGANAPAAVSAKPDLGSATNPTVVYGKGFDGREEFSYQPADMGQFTHGSAQGIKTVTEFICDRLNDKYQAPDDTVDQCRQASTAAQKRGGKAAATSFNAAMGFADPAGS